jgi:hypothetical protein
MTLRQHKRRYCGRFWRFGPGWRTDLPWLPIRRPYSRCNPVTYGG